MDTERSVAIEGGPDHSARQLIVATSGLASALLLTLHEGIAGGWPGFSDPALRMFAYTLAIGPPLMLALMVERIGERFSYAVLGLLALLLAGLAWHTGSDCQPLRSGGGWGCDSVSVPYWTTLAIALFILLPFLEAWRDAGSRLPLRLPYTSLYRHAWDNALALAGTGLFVLAAWLILRLWGALFALLGIDEFRELFEQRRFIYPVTGLLVGFGLVMSRAQGGALRALLRLCLSLARALLPFVALLALLFLSVVLLKGPEALWQTRRAASLLLSLVLAVVLLANGVYQDGDSESRYPRWLRRFVAAGLLSLPAHAGLAIWAIALRVAQHGWTPDRLSAALVAVILGLHALLLALAVLPTRDGRWLGRLSASNPLLAGVVVALLLASQSPLLDFRAISVSSQLGRLARGELRIDGYDQVDDFRRRNGPETQDRKQAEQRPRFDVRLFARELGREGRSALQTLRTDPRHAGDLGLLAAIDEALSEPEIDVTPPPSRPLLAEDIETLPAGTVLPPELLSALAADLAPLAGKKFGPGCQRQLRPCMLISVDLGGPPGPEWLFVPPAGSWNLPPLVYGASGGGGWLLLAWVYGQAGAGHPLLPETLREGRLPIAVASDWPLLQIGDYRYPIVGGRPALLMPR